MTPARLTTSDVRIQHAVDELKETIQDHYPDAQFHAGAGGDPIGVYLTAIVDIDDPDVVMDLVLDRLLQLQVKEELPVYVIPIRPLACVALVAS